MTHPGVGPLTALAYVLIIGTPTRFQRGKQIGTYVGMIPCEDSQCWKTTIGTHQQARAVPWLRFLLVEAAQAAGAYPAGLATSVPAPGDASAQEHCQGGDGTASGGSPVLDVAEWLCEIHRR